MTQAGVIEVPLHVTQLLFAHSEVMAKFVNDGLPNLPTNFIVVGTDGFDVLLVEHDVVGAGGQVEYAFPGGRHAMEDAEEQLPGMRWLVGRYVLNQNGDITDADAKLVRERVECLFD